MHTTSQDTRLHSEKVLQLARGTIRSPLGWQCDWNVGTAQKPSYCKITLACWTAYLKVCFDAFNVPIHTCYILIFFVCIHLVARDMCGCWSIEQWWWLADLDGPQRECLNLDMMSTHVLFSLCLPSIQLLLAARPNSCSPKIDTHFR